MTASYLFAGDTVETDNTFPYSGISSDAKLSMKKAVSSQGDINSSPDGAAVFDEESIDDIVKSGTDENHCGDEAIVKFSFKSGEKGSYVDVDTDQDIFEGVSRKNVPKVAQDYMKKRFKNEILDGVKVDSKGINKMTHPGNSQPLFVQKMKATTELDNIIKASVFVDFNKATKDSSKYPEYEYYGFNFKLSDQWFSGILNIGVDSNGQRHLYEINKIRQSRIPYKGTTLQERISATMTDSIINNIPTNEQDVNDLTRLYIIFLKQISYEAHVICHSKCEHKLYPGLFTRKLTAKYNSEVAQVFSSARISVT